METDSAVTAKGRMKHMTEDEQIEEMAKALYEKRPYNDLWIEDAKDIAKVLYSAGYRRQSDGEWIEKKRALLFGEDEDNLSVYICADELLDEVRRTDDGDKLPYAQCGVRTQIDLLHLRTVIKKMSVPAIRVFEQCERRKEEDHEDH